MRETDTLSAQQEQTKSDASAANPLGEQTLKLAGHSYILGDIALSAAGFIRSLAENQTLAKSEQKSWHQLLGGTAGGAAIWLRKRNLKFRRVSLKIISGKKGSPFRMMRVRNPNCSRRKASGISASSFSTNTLLKCSMARMPVVRQL